MSQSTDPDPSPLLDQQFKAMWEKVDSVRKAKDLPAMSEEEQGVLTREALGRAQLRDRSRFYRPTEEGEDVPELSPDSAKKIAQLLKNPAPKKL
jgi:hypothetical protein